MKFKCVVFLMLVLLSLTACKKKNEFACPIVVSPANYSAFHSGDTISILLYLPPAIRKDTNRIFAEVNNIPYNGFDTLNLDTIFYPTFNADHYATIRLVLKAARSGVDSNYVETGDGSPGVSSCKGITFSIQP